MRSAVGRGLRKAAFAAVLPLLATHLADTVPAAYSAKQKVPATFLKERSAGEVERAPAP